MRDLLAAKRQIIEAIGELDEDQALGLLRDLVLEMDPPNITACSGLTSSWCQIHGDCKCPDPAVALNHPGCPIHAPDSDHAGGVIAPEPEPVRHWTPHSNLPGREPNCPGCKAEAQARTDNATNAAPDA